MGKDKYTVKHKWVWFLGERRGVGEVLSRVRGSGSGEKEWNKALVERLD